MVRWWAAFGNRTCSKRALFPEQACAEKMRNKWRPYFEAVGHHEMNTPVLIPHNVTGNYIARGVTALLTACLQDRRNAVCHPAGVRHYCQHHRFGTAWRPPSYNVSGAGDNATALCMRTIRADMFRGLGSI